MNLILALISAVLWGGAYGAYFAPDVRRWWRGRRRRGVMTPIVLPPVRYPQRSRASANRPRPPGPVLLTLPPPPKPAEAAARPSNVVPFRRRPPS